METETVLAGSLLFADANRCDFEISSYSPARWFGKSPVSARRLLLRYVTFLFR
jgi:hypothetical protein